MPLDGTLTTPALNRARLIAALRAPMPEGHRWDFCEVSGEEEYGTYGCAFSIIDRLWPGATDVNADGVPVHEFIGLTREQCHAIFGVMSYQFDRFYKFPKRDVTPAMVADALEAIG